MLGHGAEVLALHFAVDFAAINQNSRPHPVVLQLVTLGIDFLAMALLFIVPEYPAA